jgi:signal transduction histidine kinase
MAGTSAVTESNSAGARLNCPNCHAPITASAVVCQACGADITLMTLAAEAGLLEAALNGPETIRPVSTEQLAPRLGDYLMQHGYVSSDQLRAALAEQARTPPGEPRRLIGQTLSDLGFLTPRDLDEAIARQLLELQTALVDANRSLERRVVERTAELEAALARLTEFNQLKANFVANISHELRTPLTHIKGYNVLLLEGTLGQISSEQNEALRVTAGAISRLEGLINDLISYAAAARGELTVHLRPVAVDTVVAQVLERSLAKAGRQRVALETDIPLDLPLVSADEEKLNWLLLQLVDNGVKFTAPGGRVVIGAQASEHRVTIRVQDSGIGIPKERLEDIFEPFRQLDGSSTRRAGGTGLGLALVRRIVEAHGAHIEVSSHVGRGSTFSMDFSRYVSK